MYLQAAAGISPQPSFEQICSSPVVYPGNRLSCIEPDYTRRIDPRMIRRMSRIIRMGVAAALDCLKASGIGMPDAIITGTAYGCLKDTEVFLSKMVENKEDLLTPTAFIQSTHNTIGAQIALLLKCHNYNNTLVQRGFSFESALLDAISLLEDREAKNVLVGGIDELTDTSFALLSRFGSYRRSLADSTSLYEEQDRGTIAGEGAAFFLVSGEPSGNDYAKLEEIDTFYKPGGASRTEAYIRDFLTAHDIRMEEIDLVITGRNGNAKDDAVYEQIERAVFKDKATARFKHLCGEYPTASSFALWLAAHCLKEKKTPAGILWSGMEAAPRRILIYNHYQNTHHALYLLSAC